jgi:hypothetical protein
MAKQPIRTGRIVAPASNSQMDGGEIQTGKLVGGLQDADNGVRVLGTGWRTVAATPDDDLGRGMAGDRLVAPAADGMMGHGMAGAKLIRPPEDQDL